MQATDPARRDAPGTGADMPETSESTDGSDAGARASADRPQARREALYLALSEVPAGKVVSYGQLAELAGLGRAARWVGRTLAQLPEGSTLPWHRVLAAGGRLSLEAGSASGDEQRARLRDEGVVLRNDRVDMRRHGWRPTEHCG
jgi:methylated-DNA-protein-cysteine methyltransferase-like protein